MTYLAGTEGQRAQMKVGRLPTLKKLTSDNNDFFMEYLQFATPRPALPIGASYGKELADLQTEMIRGALSEDQISERLKKVKELLAKKMARFCNKAGK
jgi:hypothetical protein